ISLGLALDANTAGAQSLTFNAGSAGRVTIGGTIGGATPIGDLEIDANQIVLGASINSQGGNLAFNAPVVLSSGFDGRQIVVATNANGAGNGSIAFNGTIDAQDAGAVGLFLQTGGGEIGGTTPIGDLTVTASLINLYSDITTQSNKVEFDGPVVLQNSIAINTSGGQVFNVPAGSVTFNGTVDAASSGAQSLTIQAGGQGSDADHAPGTVTFAADVGDNAALDTLLVRGGDMSLQNIATTGSQYYVANGV